MGKPTFYHAPSAIAGLFIGTALTERTTMPVALAIAAAVLIVAGLWTHWRSGP